MSGKPKRRRSARVFTLPGVERRDLSPAPPARQVLQCALDAGLSDVTLVGVDRAGKLYVAGSVKDVDKVVGLFMRGVTYLTSGQVRGPDGDPADEVA